MAKVRRTRRRNEQKAATWDEMTPATRAIVAELLVHGPLARTELAYRLALSPAIVTTVTRPLVECGLLLERAPLTQIDSGRPVQPLAVVADWQHVIGIKLNREDLFAVRTDLHARVVRQVSSSMQSAEVDAVTEQIIRAVDDLDTPDPVAMLGISLAANIRPGDRVVREAPYLGWTGVELAEAVSARTGLPVVLSNDVRALTAAQHWFGLGRLRRCFAVITVGKGVGCGLVVNNDLVAGYDGHAGLVSHLPIAEGGPLCTRGHRGCASAYLSSGAIVRSLSGAYDHHQAGFEDGLQAARMRSPAALRVFTDACFALGALTGYVANLVGPDRVVLSGEGIGMCEVAPEALQAGMARHLHWNAAPFELDIHPFAFDEWARGAAAVAIQSLVRPRGTVAA